MGSVEGVKTQGREVLYEDHVSESTQAQLLESSQDIVCDMLTRDVELSYIHNFVCEITGAKTRRPRLASAAATANLNQISTDLLQIRCVSVVELMPDGVL